MLNQPDAITIVPDFKLYDHANRFKQSGATITYNDQVIRIDAADVSAFIAEMHKATGSSGRLSDILHANQSAHIARSSAAAALMREKAQAEADAIEAEKQAKRIAQAEKLAQERQAIAERAAAARQAEEQAAQARRRDHAERYAAAIEELANRD